MSSRLKGILLTLLIWLGFPTHASAHLVNSGLGPFYDGIAHVFMTPEDLLAVIATALLAGLAGRQTSRHVVFGFPAAWFIGALFGRIAPLSPGAPLLGAILLTVLGALVALGWQAKASRQFAAESLLAVGLILGFFNGAVLANAKSGVLPIAGIGCAIFVVTVMVAGQVGSLEKQWARIAVRVAGSWIGAIGLLMIGWAVR